MKKSIINCLLLFLLWNSFFLFSVSYFNAIAYKNFGLMHTEVEGFLLVLFGLFGGAFLSASIYFSEDK